MEQWQDDNRVFSVQFHTLEDITQYADGGTISTNKYYNLVCGIIHSDVNGHRMMCIVQNEPSSEYVSVTGAEVDTYDALNVFPSNASAELLDMCIWPRSSTTNMPVRIF